MTKCFEYGKSEWINHITFALIYKCLHITFYKGSYNAMQYYAIHGPETFSREIFPAKLMVPSINFIFEQVYLA